MTSAEKWKKIGTMISIFRVFIITALVVSGAVELYASDLWSTPFSQIGIAAVAGAIGATAAKVAHIV